MRTLRRISGILSDLSDQVEDLEGYIDHSILDEKVAELRSLIDDAANEKSADEEDDLEEDEDSDDEA